MTRVDDVNPAYQRLLETFGAAARHNQPLSRYTVARLGGPADVVIEVKDRDVLQRAVSLCWRNNLPMRIIGGGANILVSDAGYRGVVIVNGTKSVSIDEPSGRVLADSGVGLIGLARETMAHGLSGFEWAISVPGTVGGAVVNNAGAHGSDMAASLLAAHILSEPGEQKWATAELHYQYRESALKRSVERYVVLTAELQLTSGHDPAALRAKADEFLAHRKRTQPPGASLGSMFKNPPGDYAGRLIEAAGLKGAQIGGVIISPVHANFFVNVGGGSAADYRGLIRLAQARVREQFGVALELEVELIGEGFG